MGRGGRPGPEREGGGLSAPGEAGRGCSGRLHPWHPGRLRAPSLRRSAWPVHASCTARLPPRHLEPQRAATPTVLGGWGQGPRRKGSPSGVAEGVSRTGQGGCRGTLRRDPGGRAGVRSWTTQLVTVVWVPLSFFPSLPLLPPHPQTPFQSSGLDTSRTTRHHGLVDRVYRERGRLGSPHRRPLSVDKHGRQISFSQRRGWAGTTSSS